MLYTSYFKIAHKIPEEISQISISRRPSQNYYGQEYKELAPSEELFNRYKYGDLAYNWNAYTKIYTEETLCNLDCFKVLDDLKRLAKQNKHWNGEDIALICWEGPKCDCHRHLARGWFNRQGIECVELNIKEYNKRVLIKKLRGIG